MAHGDFTMLLPDDPHVYAYTRAYEGTELLVLVNVSGAEGVADVDPAWARRRAAARQLHAGRAA